MRGSPCIVDTAAAEHEAVHTHAQVLALGLEALPDEHAGALDPGHLAGSGRDLVTTCTRILTSGHIFMYSQRCCNVESVDFSLDMQIV